MMFKNIVGEDRNFIIAVSIFSFSHIVFKYGSLNFKIWSYICFVVCKSFQFGQVWNLIIW